MIQETESNSHSNKGIRRNPKVEEESTPSLNRATAAHQGHQDLHKAHLALIQVLGLARTDPVKSKASLNLGKKLIRRKMTNE